MSDVISLNVSFDDKDRAKSLGARWDPQTRKWCISSSDNLELFKEWLPPGYKITTIEPIKTTEKYYTIRELKSIIQGAVTEKFPRKIWIIGEIIKIKPTNGHLYIDLQDDEAVKSTNQKYTLRANIWKDKVDLIQSKLKQFTGQELTEQQRVKFEVKIEYNPQYDLSAVVSDIDPEITLGQIALQQKQIKQKLEQEGIFSNNKQLPRPIDFCRIVVIHPDNASGFQDFKDQADKICHICQCIYFSSRFEGGAVENDMQQAFANALKEHQKSPIDALIIIRGGGARLGLLSLITENIIRSIATFPAPVIVGIGHTDDKLLIDEVAHTSYGTPSKVIENIFNTIRSRANQAQLDFSTIIARAKARLTVCSNNIDSYKSIITSNAKNNIKSYDAQVDNLIILATKRAKRLLQAVDEQVAIGFSDIKAKSREKMAFISKDLTNKAIQIQAHSLRILSYYSSNIQDQHNIIRNNSEKLLHTLTGRLSVYYTYIITSATKRVKVIEDDINSKTAVINRAGLIVSNKKSEIDQLIHDIRLGARRQIGRLSEKIDTSFQSIEALSPKNTLKRGYCLPIGKQGVIKNALAAKHEQQFTLQFSDGDCKVRINEE